MFVVIAATAQNAINYVRVMGNIGVITTTAALKVQPVNFALVSVCAGVTLTGAAVVSRKTMGSAGYSSSAGYLNPVLDDGGNCACFALPQTNNFQYNAKLCYSCSSGRAERERREALLVAREKKIEAQKTQLATSYSNFSIVDTTFDKEPVYVVGRPPKIGADPYAMSMQEKMLPDKSGASVAFSNVSPAGTPEGGTPTSRSVVHIMVTEEGKALGFDTWDAPPQNPIVITEGHSNDSAKTSASSSSAKTSTASHTTAALSDSQRLSFAEKKKTSKSIHLKKNAIVNMVDLGDTTSAVLGSQLVEVDLSESAENSSKSARYWSFLTKSIWNPVQADEPKCRPVCPV